METFCFFNRKTSDPRTLLNAYGFNQRSTLLSKKNTNRTSQSKTGAHKKQSEERRKDQSISLNEAKLAVVLNVPQKGEEAKCLRSNHSFLHQTHTHTLCLTSFFSGKHLMRLQLMSGRRALTVSGSQQKEKVKPPNSPLTLTAALSNHGNSP